MKLSLKEPLSARYLYLSPENIIHIFMPIVSGTTIGLDNTCKAVYALQEFFDKGSNSNKKASLKAELLTYKEALESDMSLLGAKSPLLLQKQERLTQIDGYLKVLERVEHHPELNCLNSGFPSYPRPLEGMIQDRATSNLYSMVLRPEVQDGYLRTEGVNPIFRVAHKSVSRHIESTHFLQLVAYGQQHEAESLLKKDAALAQELLTARDIDFTDYSGRTFTCSAYEYAWWAKDSHMRFMLERYMNEDTKHELLKRVQHIEEPIGTGTLFKEPRGLVYIQKGKEYRSAHFDLTPLKKALKTYIEAYEQSPKDTDADWEALDAAWIRVGLPQREVPAHIAQEYCHPKRSFDDAVKNPALLDASNPANLERQLKFYNWNTSSDDDWFTPQGAAEDSGLGSSFAILRRAACVGIGRCGRGARMSLGAIDLSAIEAIDEARTKDLKQSLERLAVPSKTPRLFFSII